MPWPHIAEPFGQLSHLNSGLELEAIVDKGAVELWVFCGCDANSVSYNMNKATLRVISHFVGINRPRWKTMKAFISWNYMAN